jgi:hypothetical protein
MSCKHTNFTWDSVDTVYECRGCESRFIYDDNGDEPTFETVPLTVDTGVVKQSLEIISGAIDDMVGGRPVEDAVGEIGNAVDRALAVLGSAP